MRAIVLLLCFVASSAWASSIPVTPPPNIGATSGGWTTIGATTFGGGAASVEMRAGAAGVIARIPATARLGANAASVGLAAIRLNPVGLATSAVLQYLIQVGIQKCSDGTWCVPQQSPNANDTGFNGYQWTTGGNNGTIVGASPDAVCTAYVASFSGFTRTGITPSSPTQWICNFKFADGTASGHGINRMSTCVAGYVLSGGSCVVDPNAAKVPAGDADWNKALTYPMPDQVATDLSAAKVPLPVTIAPNTTPITLNLSDPYVDPVTGKRYRDVAVITPNADGKTASLNVVKQEVDANGSPVTDPATGGVKPPEEQKDPCTGHETRLGCTEQGDVPDGPDLKEQKISVAITPDGGWGSDTAACPADLTAMVHGLPVALSFKPVCDGADMFRPIIIACAWLGAALIVVGAGRKGEE